MMSPLEEANLKRTKKTDAIRTGRIQAVSGSTVRVLFDGEETASEKYYRTSKSLLLAVGDRVVCAAVAGTYIILAEI